MLGYRLRFVCAAWLGLSGGVIVAAAPTAPSGPPEAQQFDFWLGEWSVTTPDGKPAGSNRVERVAGGRALLENWTSAKGGEGKSLNAWNAEKKQWQQFWVGHDGGVLELAGGAAGGSMILRGDHAVGGQRTLERITWTPNADGSVRQLWEQSIDGGKTWSVAFDGHYVKKGPQTAVRAGGGGGGDGLRRMYFLFL